MRLPPEQEIGYLVCVWLSVDGYLLKMRYGFRIWAAPLLGLFFGSSSV